MYQIAVQRKKDSLTENLSYDNLNTHDLATAEEHLWMLCQKYQVCDENSFNAAMLGHEAFSGISFYGTLDDGLVTIQMSTTPDITYYKWHVRWPLSHPMPFISINIANEKGGAEIQINWRDLQQARLSPEFFFFEEGIPLILHPQMTTFFTELTKLPPDFSPEECEAVLLRLGFQDNTKYE